MPSPTVSQAPPRWRSGSGGKLSELPSCRPIGRASRKIIEFNNSDHASRATAALQVLRALLPLVLDPTFIPSIQYVASIVEAENPAFGEWARDLARGLEYVTLFKSVVADEQRRTKPVERKNPGKPYMAGLAESLVSSWHEWTGEYPFQDPGIS